MTGAPRSGLRGRPEDGWPLDRVWVSVAAVRSTRELFHQKARGFPEPVRAWDLALWSGVSPQGAGSALRRMERIELVEATPPDRPGRARGYRVVPTHPLAAPLTSLFRAESIMVPRPRHSRGSPRRSG